MDKPEIKLKLSIDRIGKYRFYLGIAIGALTGLILNFLIKYFSKSYIYILLSLSAQKSIDFNFSLSSYNEFFVSLISSSLGFCFVAYLWSSKIIKGRKVNYKYRLSQYNSLFVFGLILFVFSRFVLIYFTLPFDSYNFELEKDYGYLPFIIPLYIFTYNWSFILISYKSSKFFYLSLLGVIIFGLILSQIKI